MNEPKLKQYLSTENRSLESSGYTVIPLTVGIKILSAWLVLTEPFLN